MRIYKDKQETQLERVICNCCGRELTVENGIVMQDCFHGDHVFGYFSEKDGVRHQFDLCESCYDSMAEQFKIPVNAEELVEYL